MYTTPKPKKVEGHVAELTQKAGDHYIQRQHKARDIKAQQMDKYVN